MCGFVGFIGDVEDKEQVLSNMMDTIIHRGPDSEGKHIDDDIALGFRRLSIIDLSSEGDQPLYNEDGSMVLVFNGEIYNYKEIRAELIEAGHVFSSNTDSETVLHGYEEWGADVLYRLRGMFAFALWDSYEKMLFMARDRFGIKPLYFADMNGTLMFGSEIKSFLEHPKFDKVFNESALGNYLSFQFVPTEETFFKGVYCLPAGYYADCRKGAKCFKHVFRPQFTGDSRKSFEEVVEDVERVMKESVEMHKISDVEVASYLSSGVDSSYLTYLGQVDHTFTVGFEEGAYSEIQEAKEFAASINMKNDARVIQPDEYWDKLSDIQYYMDEPVADPAAVALYFLSEEASKKVKVVLSGEGSDELFGGYNIYCEPLEHRSFDRIPMFFRRGMGKFAEYCLPRGMKGRGFLMRHGKTLEERYFSNATNIFTEREANKLLKKGCERGIQKVTKVLYEEASHNDPVTKMQYVDMHLWLPHDILMKGDKMGMANSLEVRVPFLDAKVLELAETLPLEYKVRAPRTKVALRAAAEKAIRSKTAEKKKLGFPIPIRIWLKEDKYYNRVKEMFTSEAAKKFFHTEQLVKLLDDHKSGKNTNEKTDNSRKIWTVYIFLVWYDRFFEHGKPVHPIMNNK